jgi:hypothetical protein
MVNYLICGKNVHRQSKYGIMPSCGKVLLDRRVEVDLFGKLMSRPSGRAIRSLVFFVLFYLYLWLDVDLRLLYHGGGVIINFPFFYRGWEFFRDFLVYPGGPVKYLSAFLAQSFYYSWAGAIVVTAVAWLICVCTDFFFRAVNAPYLRWVRFVGPVLLLAIYTQYALHFVTTMALLAALVFVCLYLKVTPKNKSIAVLVFLVLSAILYYLAGGAYLLFAVLCALYELLFARRWQLCLVYLLSVAVISYVESVVVFDVSISYTFGSLLQSFWKTTAYETRKKILILVYMLYVHVPLAALCGGFWRTYIEKKVSGVHNKAIKPLVKLYRWYTAVPLRRGIAGSVVLVVIAGATVFFYHSEKLKSLFAVDYYACHEMWPEVLSAAPDCSDSFFAVHAVNRALYHTGRLGYEMFAWPQHADALLLTDERFIHARWKKFDAYIELGFMNMAENMLNDSLGRVGNHPMIFKRLALVNMVKGDTRTAGVYLGTLTKTLLGNKWACDYLARLEADPNLSGDDVIQHFRSLMIKRDYGTDFPYDNETVFLDLLESNRKNRMAFEYLMAWYLLTRQLERFERSLDRLDDFDYSRIPRHYEEAMLLYAAESRKPVDLRGRQISPETVERYKGFVQIYQSYWKNKQAAMSELASHYGDSYFFYYLYGFSGVQK